MEKETDKKLFHEQRLNLPRKYIHTVTYIATGISANNVNTSHPIHSSGILVDSYSWSLFKAGINPSTVRVVRHAVARYVKNKGRWISALVRIGRSLFSLAYYTYLAHSVLPRLCFPGWIRVEASAKVFRRRGGGQRTNRSPAYFRSSKR